MERETGIEPATNGLEGRDSTTELLPRPDLRSAVRLRRTGCRSRFLVARGQAPSSIRRSRHRSATVGPRRPFVAYCKERKGDTTRSRHERCCRRQRALVALLIARRPRPGWIRYKPRSPQATDGALRVHPPAPVANAVSGWWRPIARRRPHPRRLAPDGFATSGGGRQTTDAPSESIRRHQQRTE